MTSRDNDNGSIPERDDAIASTEGVASEKAASAARLFDVRRIIGGLFVVYGVIVLVAGLIDGDDAKEKAAGIDINIWTGLGMLLLGGFFLVWMQLNPTDIKPAEGSEDDRDQARPQH